MKKFGQNINNYLKDGDMFGHQIRMNFNRSGESHKTLIGGMGSLLISGFLILYIYIRTKMFVFKEADDNFTENIVIDIDHEDN